MASSAGALWRTRHLAVQIHPTGGMRPPAVRVTDHSPTLPPVDLEFTGELWFWKGPAPWHFVTVPDEQCGALEAVASHVSYGWGMVPVTAHIGRTEWTTSLWPKDGAYVVPVKTWVRRAEKLELGDEVNVRLRIDS
jgi:hypothetical protein